MRLFSVLFMIIMMYLGLIYLAFSFRPPEVTYTTDVSVLRQYVKDCEGDLTVFETVNGYEMTCEVK